MEESLIRIRAFATAGIAVLFAHVAAAQTTSSDVTLTITEDSGKYVLAVPVSNLVMTVPKGRLRVGTADPSGATASPRYFLFADSSQNLMISGWFESADGFSDIHSFWSAETASWKRDGLPEPRNVSFVHLGKWNAILYDLAAPVGNNTHIRAHWVEAGTWIDIHLSVGGPGSITDLRRRLRELLQTIQVNEKRS